MAAAPAKPGRSDIKDADEWWGSLTDAKRVQYHRWLTGKGKLPPPSQTETLFDLAPPDTDALDEEETGGPD